MKRYSTSLSPTQRTLLLAAIGDRIPTLRKYTLSQIFDALLYVVKTGCPWNMLPSEFPDWKTVYHHFRSWSEKEIFSTLLSTLVEGRRAAMGQDIEATTAVIDSESVRSGLPQSQKGIDGNKKTKGIKRQLLTDMNGYPLLVHCTAANLHDSKGGVPILEKTAHRFPSITEIRADRGYRGCINSLTAKGSGIEIICVKSNLGTSQFIPIEGRWVVERTFSWMTNYRRLVRNYEKYLRTAAQMYVLGCVAYMLRFF